MNAAACAKTSGSPQHSAAQLRAQMSESTPDLPKPGAAELQETDAAHQCFSAAEELLAQNRFAEALAKHREAVRLGIDAERGAPSRWKCCMMLGDFAAAWRETDGTEARRKRRGDTTRHLPVHWQRVWDGTPLTGKRVLVRCYHGLGDTIQFARYLPLLKKICSSVIVHCQPALLELVTSVCDLDEVIPVDCYAHQPPPLCDGVECEIEMMELPYAFRTTLGTIPGAVPYLFVPRKLVAAKRAALARDVLNDSHPRAINSHLVIDGPRFTVGLLWSSGSWNPERSMALEQLKPLGKIPGIRWISLQQGPPARQIECRRARCQEEWELDGLSGSETPLETAAIICNLDLILSVDTMVAHLAGALGKPVWTLLPFAADWRWMSGRDDSPWYPTMRLFRQDRPHDWSGVVAALCVALSTEKFQRRTKHLNPGPKALFPATYPNK